MSNFEKVGEFHQKFGCSRPSPTARKKLGFYPVSSDEKMLRVRLMNEELAELIAGMQLDDDVKIADSLADLLYVVYGTAVSYGMPIDEIFSEVHRSNMTKSTSLDAGGKVTKGENFSLPELDSILGRKNGT